MLFPIPRPWGALLTLTTLFSAHSSLGQPGVPPIDMSLSQFNQGRPADFYYLAEASEGYAEVCEQVHAALDEPYPKEPYAQYVEHYSKYLLRSRLSVPWVEMPETAAPPSNPTMLSRNPWNIRFASVDLNNDGSEEDVFVSISNLSGLPVHTFAVVNKGILPQHFDEVTPEMFTTLIAEGAFQEGRRITDQFSGILAAKYADYNRKSGGTLRFDRHFLDVIDLNGTRFIFLTGSSPIQTKLGAMLFKLAPSGTIESVCRFTSRYKVSR